MGALFTSGRKKVSFFSSIITYLVSIFGFLDSERESIKSIMIATDYVTAILESPLLSKSFLLL